MIKEERDKILKALAEDRNYYARECERRIAEEQGKVTGADYMLQRLLDVLKTEVEPQESEDVDAISRQSGKWIVGRISPTKLRGENLIEYRCSKCDREIRCTESQLVNYPYCHCGARMVEPQERSDKE